jgi:tetratricopeptide (TPR) repeat protein
MPSAIPIALNLLEAASLIRPSDAAGDGEYRFKHNLIQETAYAGLLRERRSELHRQVAEAILRVNPEAAMYQPAVLALHYYHGGDDDRAFRFALRAGHLARRNYAHQEAVANYDLALEVAPRLASKSLAPQIREAFIGKGTALEISGHHSEALRVYHAMQDFARRTGNPSLEADALNRLATAATVSSDPQADVGGLLARAEQLARQAADPLTLARTLWNQGLRLRFLDPVRADDFFRQALEITRRPACLDLPNGDEFKELEAFILIDLTVCRMTSGRRLEALRNGAEALQAFQHLGNRAMIADAMAGLGLMRFEGGEFDVALSLSDEGRSISSAIENPWGIAYNGWVRLAILADRGEWSEALDFGRHLLDVSTQVPFVGIRGSLNGIVSNIWIGLGDNRQALAYAQTMRDIVQGAGGVELWQIWSRGVLGRALVANGEIAAASAVLEPHRDLPSGVIPASQDYYYAGPAIAALDVAQGEFDRGLRFANQLIDRLQAERADRYTAEMRYWRAHLHLGKDALAEADADLSWAIKAMAPTLAKAVLWPMHALRAEVLGKMGDASAAGREHASAVSMVEAIAAGLPPALRAPFLGQPAVAPLLGQVSSP